MDFVVLANKFKFQQIKFLYKHHQNVLVLIICYKTIAIHKMVYVNGILLQELVLWVNVTKSHIKTFVFKLQIVIGASTPVNVKL